MFHTSLSHAISRGLFVGVVYTWTRAFRLNLLSQHCDVTVKLIVRLIDCGWVSSVPSQLPAHLERTVVMARTEEEIKLVPERCALLERLDRLGQPRYQRLHAQTVSPANIRQTLVPLLFSLCACVTSHLTRNPYDHYL